MLYTEQLFYVSIERELIINFAILGNTVLIKLHHHLNIFDFFGENAQPNWHIRTIIRWRETDF